MQDNTPGFMALPPLPESMSEVSSKRVRTAQTSNGRRQFDSGGLTARLDPESVDLAIDEFNLRIRYATHLLELGSQYRSRFSPSTHAWVHTHKS